MIFYCIGSKERGDMTMMNRIRSRFGFTVCLLVLLIVALAVPASAANYKKLYGTTKDRLRLRESASSNATTIDNLAKDRCVYIIQSKDSGGITWIEVKYRTHEGGTETGWVAQTDGKTTFVTVLSTSQAKKLYNVSDGNLPSKPTGLWTAKERSAAKSSGSSSSGSSSSASSDNVKMAQSVLKDMGIYAGEITGNMGDKTVAAIKEFQKRYGLTRDGQLGPDTLSKLRSVGGSSASSGSSSSTSADAVKRAQGQLKELGIYSGEITGKVGSKTTAAIKEFQRRNGLTADGVLGSSTIARLDEVAGSGSSSSGVSSDTIKDVQAKLGNMGIYSGEVTGNLGSKTTAAIKEFQKRYNLTQDGIPGPATVTKLNQVYSNTSTVKVSSSGAGLGIGSSGTAVATLQQNLTALGYYWAEITGNFGAKTQEAVERFQKAYGLPQDGVAGEATLSAIKTAVGKKGGSSSSGSSGSINTSSILQLNSTGSNVTALQNKLAALGYYKGEITGHYGEKTRDAVKAFQSKNGLVADGIAGPSTLKAISSAKSSSGSGSSSSGGSSGSSAVSSTTLTVGSTGAAVRSLQTNLTTLGYYSGDITGHYGSQTGEAVRKYQKAKGLSQTGTATPSLQSRIASDTGSGSGSGSKVVIKTSLKQGDSGDAVRDLQNALYKLGFYNGTISGNYGSLTAAAVRRFQDKNDLTVDGIAGSKTITLINQKAGSSISPSSGSSGSSGNTGSGTTTLVSYARVSATSALLRTSATTSSKSKTTLKHGTQMKISKKTVTGGQTWYYVQAYQDGYTYIGYVRSDLVTIISAADFKAASEHNSDADDEVDGVIEVRSSDVAVREGPGTDYEIARRAQYGDIYTYVDLTSNGYYKLIDGNYISAAYCSESVDTSKLDNLDTNVYRYDDTAPMVATIQEWLKTLKYYDGDVTGHYGSKTVDAVAAFQRDNGLTDDGIAGKKTIAALQAKISGGSGQKIDYTGKTVYNINWFAAQANKDYFSSIGFVAGQYAKLTDLTTGITINIKIQSTGNHIDAEPATASDTAKFCSMYGVASASSITSSTHYQRRPMLIETSKGVKAVCSMYGVPHGKQTILNNNYSGQFCLHFKNSKTSGTNKVDTAKNGHQAMINKAIEIVKANGGSVQQAF
jgi:peptidoglycan hydrolase-like protein with peptidoglycan-binding domain